MLISTKCIMSSDDGTSSIGCTPAHRKVRRRRGSPTAECKYGRAEEHVSADKSPRSNPTAAAVAMRCLTAVVEGVNHPDARPARRTVFFSRFASLTPENTNNNTTRYRSQWMWNMRVLPINDVHHLGAQTTMATTLMTKTATTTTVVVAAT